MRIIESFNKFINEGGNPNQFDFEPEQKTDKAVTSQSESSQSDHASPVDISSMPSISSNPSKQAINAVNKVDSVNYFSFFDPANQVKTKCVLHMRCLYCNFSPTFLKPMPKCYQPRNASNIKSKWKLPNI